MATTTQGDPGGASKPTAAAPGSGAAQTGGGRPQVLVLNGPNLNLLGEREPHVYGRTTLADIDAALIARGRELGIEVRSVQSNHEGVLIDEIQGARLSADALIINAGGLTHTSVALRDAVAAANIPAIEVHVSNLARRESFRHVSLLTAVCVGQISGLGAVGYRLALDAAVELLKEKGRLPG